MKGGSGIVGGAGAPVAGVGAPEALCAATLAPLELALRFIPGAPFPVPLGRLALVGVSSMGEEASEEGTSSSLVPADGFRWNEGGPELGGREAVRCNGILFGGWRGPLEDGNGTPEGGCSDTIEGGI